MPIQITEHITDTVLTESPVKVMVESPLKVLVGNAKTPSIEIEGLSITAVQDFPNPPPDMSWIVTEYDRAIWQWRDDATWDNVNHFGSSFDIFSGAPENTDFTLSGDGTAMIAGITKGWFNWMMAQPISVSVDLTPHYTDEANPPVVLVTGYPEGSATQCWPYYDGVWPWMRSYAQTGWNVVESIIMSRGRAHYNGAGDSIPYFIGRARAAGPVIGSSVGLNGATYRIDFIKSGMAAVVGGHAIVEAPWYGYATFGMLPSQPFTSLPSFDIGHISNPFLSDSVSAILPIWADFNFVVMGQDPGTFASNNGFVWNAGWQAS